MALPPLKRKPSDSELEALQAEKARFKRIKAAAESGDIDEARACLAEGIRIDEAYKGGGPPALAVAAKAGKTDFVHWGLCHLYGPLNQWHRLPHDDARAKLVQQCSDHACLDGRIDTLEMLCRFGADLNRPLAGSPHTPVELALRLNLPELYSFASAKWAPGAGSNPISLALRILKNPEESPWFESICAAAKRLGSFALEQAGSDGAHAPHALAAAAGKGLACFVEPLAALGAPVNAPDKANGMTPLMLAVKHPECVRLLLRLGAEPSARCGKGWTALRHAFHAKAFDSAEILFERRPNRWWSGLGPSALWSSVHFVSEHLRERPEQAELLRKIILDLPPDELARDDDNPTTFRFNLAGALLAMQLKECFIALLSRGTDPNAPNSQGFTPLGQAATSWPRHEGDHQSILDMLRWSCALGADPARVDSTGRDLLALALERQACPSLLAAAADRLDMESKRLSGWSTLAEMVLAGYKRAQDYDSMAVRGHPLDEVSDWMQAVGAARGSGSADLARELMSRALACKERWELAQASSASKSPTAALAPPRL